MDFGFSSARSQLDQRPACGSLDERLAVLQPRVGAVTMIGLLETLGRSSRRRRRRRASMHLSDVRNEARWKPSHPSEGARGQSGSESPQIASTREIRTHHERRREEETEKGG